MARSCPQGTEERFSNLPSRPTAARQSQQPVGTCANPSDQPLHIGFAVGKLVVLRSVLSSTLTVRRHHSPSTSFFSSPVPPVCPLPLVPVPCTRPCVLPSSTCQLLFMAPLPIMLLVWVEADGVLWYHSGFVLPSLIFAGIVLPLWSKQHYGMSSHRIKIIQ